MRKICGILAVILALLCFDACFAEEENPYKTPGGYDVYQAGALYSIPKEITYYSTTCEKDRLFNLYLPVNYTEEKTYPVLYLLHGIGGNHAEWKGGKPEIIIGNLVKNGEAPEMIIVTPNIKAFHVSVQTAGTYSAETFAAFDNFINELKNDIMPYMKENYSIAEGRENTAIAGLSMGGREALYIGLSMPETFGYVGAFCPAPGVLPYYAEKGLFENESFKAAEGYDTLILINAGLTDNVVGEWPKTYSDTLTANGTEHIFYECIGGHDFFVWKNGLYNFAKRIFD